MVRCKILVKAPYSDYQGAGSNRVARVCSPGDIVNFPYFYAQALQDKGMVEILTGYSIEGEGFEGEVIEIDESESMEITPPDEPPLASDSAIEFARDNGLDLGGVTPTGADNRIILADVRLYHKTQLSGG